MRIHVERTVPFPRGAVYSWWTDFREDDHGSLGSPARSRREILRRSNDEVVLRDRATRPARVTIEAHVTLDPPDGNTVEARYPGADVRYGYRFLPAGKGTRIILDADIRARGIGYVILPFLHRWARRYVERDTDFHLRRMAEDLTPPASARGPPR